MEYQHHILWFGPHTLTFAQNIGQMVICPVRRTYNHVCLFLCYKERKKAFKIRSRATLAIAKFLYLFRISQLARKL